MCSREFTSAEGKHWPVHFPMCTSAVGCFPSCGHTPEMSWYLNVPINEKNEDPSSAFEAAKGHLVADQFTNAMGGLALDSGVNSRLYSRYASNHDGL